MPISIIFTDLALGFAIGLTLGLLGGGGSILTVPALVYLAGQNPQAAITASLVIVGANSLVGAWFHRRQGTLNWRVALVFGGAGMGAAYLAAGFSQSLPPGLLMVLFAGLMLVVGGYMLFSKAPLETESKKPNWWLTAFVGLGVGTLTGFLGVGGGFLVVPALVILVGLSMPHAVGTSLLVIAMNSTAGFLGHLTSPHLDLLVIGLFVVAGLVGTFAGARLAQRINPGRLRQGFALFVLVLAVFLLYDNLINLA